MQPARSRSPDVVLGEFAASPVGIEAHHEAVVMDANDRVGCDNWMCLSLPTTLPSTATGRCCAAYVPGASRVEASSELASPNHDATTAFRPTIDPVPSATVLARGSHRPNAGHARSRPCNPRIVRDAEQAEVLWFRPPVAARGCRSRTTSAVSDSIPRPTRRRRGTTLSRAGGCCSAGSHPRGPSRVAGFPLVGFGVEVASGSSDSTMAISSPGSRSEARDGRR